MSIDGWVWILNNVYEYGWINVAVDHWCETQGLVSYEYKWMSMNKLYEYEWMSMCINFMSMIEWVWISTLWV